ncbi:MAG TPA: hypothetical protein VF077_12885 [Nitrospiraceae bacterium]
MSNGPMACNYPQNLVQQTPAFDGKKRKRKKKKMLKDVRLK